MGEVWEALLEGPQGFSKPVALKILKQVHSESAWGALVSEARLGALLQHPNVVSALELGESDGVWFVSMELVRGASLQELLQAGPLSAPAVLDIGLQTCQALTHVHELHIDGRPAGLVHRDVKPANLLVDATGLVKLADLGIARLGAEATDRAGTSGYMAPEQLIGEVQDARADLFSLGATLCTLATAKRAFKTTHAVLGGASQELVDEVDLAVPGLGRVVERCLQSNPDDRYADMRELQQALTELRSSSSGSTLLELLRGIRPDLVTRVGGSHSGGTPTVIKPRGNMVAERDRRFGRTHELQSLRQQVQGPDRLITLLGTGGVGKTRLASTIGRELQAQLVGGAWFIDVSDAHTGEELCLAVAGDLSLPAGADSVAAVGSALAALGQALVVLDNLEQCIEVAAAVVPRWLDAAPQVTLLCTSRIPLGVRGEARVPVGPLSTDDAVAMLRDRSDQPDLDESSASALVEAVDGLPLAIELAAARLRLLPIGSVLQRLDDRLRLLSGGAADLPARHRSLRASLDASVELLPPWVRGAFAQLSVFEGGFTVQAAEAVLDLRAWPDAGWALDAVQTLGEASLLGCSDQRFTMLQVVGDHARELLEPDDRAAAWQRHGAWFAQLGSQDSIRATRGPGGARLTAAMAADLDNIIAACRRAVLAADPRTASAAARVAFQVLHVRGPIVLGLELLRAVLDLEGLTSDELSMLNYNLAWAAFRVLDLDLAQRHYEATLQTVATPVGEAVTRAALALVFRDRHDLDRARALLEEARALFEAHGPPQHLGEVLANLGLLALDEHDPDRAEVLLLEARALHRDSGFLRGEGIVVGNLALTMSRRDRLAESRALLLEAIEIHHETGNPWMVAIDTGNLGFVDMVEEDVAAARQRFERAAEQSLQVGNLDHASGLLAALAVLELDAGTPEQARLFIDRARQVAEVVGPASVADLQPIRAAVLAAEGGLRQAEGLILQSLDRSLTQPPLRQAQVLLFAARIALARDDAAAASDLLQQAERLHQSLPMPSYVLRHGQLRVRRRLAGLPPFLAR